MTAVMPYLESFAQWASQNGTIITAVLGVVGVLSAFGVALTSIGFLLPAFMAGLSTVGAIIGAIGAPILIAI